MKRPFPYVALRGDGVAHVISHTRPPAFSVCNIEKLRIGPGDEARSCLESCAVGEPGIHS